MIGLVRDRATLSLTIIVDVPLHVELEVWREHRVGCVRGMAKTLQRETPFAPQLYE